ncbi:hypothetical protein UR09_06690 [Candidatus Nitromaritima sp. SCGC AAA799-A02]|nr:hypothetical protein UR09_06690 [Candidatus Nitromaritima sp. SCGC AAA799-A02]
MKKTLIILGVVLLIVGFYFLPDNSNSNEAKPKVDFKTVEMKSRDPNRVTRKSPSVFDRRFESSPAGIGLFWG